MTRHDRPTQHPNRRSGITIRPTDPLGVAKYELAICRTQDRQWRENMGRDANPDLFAPIVRAAERRVDVALAAACSARARLGHVLPRVVRRVARARRVRRAVRRLVAVASTGDGDPAPRREVVEGVWGWARAMAGAMGGGAS